MDIYALLYHLKQCPESFLELREATPGENSLTKILVKDTFRKIYGNFNVADSVFPQFIDVKELSENHLLSIQIGCWLFSYSGFHRRPALVAEVEEFFFNDLLEVCYYVKPREWVEDDDRAEEFVRMALKRCQIIPTGETPKEAMDKLDALDTLKRQAVLKDSTAAMERIREIRRKMAEQKAREAANVYGRE